MQLIFHIRDKTDYASSNLKILYFNTTKIQSISFLGRVIIKSRSHNRTERESKGVGRDMLISKKLFLELCGPRGNSFR